FIGTNLARIAIGKGHAVRALVRRTSARAGLERLGAEVTGADLLTGEGVAEALRGIDRVLHLAGATKAKTIEEPYRWHTETPRGLISAVAATPKPARFVYCSS